MHLPRIRYSSQRHYCTFLVGHPSSERPCAHAVVISARVKSGLSCWIVSGRESSMNYYSIVNCLTLRKNTTSPLTASNIPSSEVLWYLDNTALHSTNAWQHLQILKTVLGAFRATGLQISPEKAQLFQNSIQYLGHEISAQGVHVPTEYTKVVRDFLIPDTLRTLRAFFGKCGYYRRLIANYATIAAPLIQSHNRTNMNTIPDWLRIPQLSKPSRN